MTSERTWTTMEPAASGGMLANVVRRVVSRLAVESDWREREQRIFGSMHEQARRQPGENWEQRDWLMEDT